MIETSRQVNYTKRLSPHQNQNNLISLLHQSGLLHSLKGSLLDSIWKKAKNEGNVDMMAFIEEIRFEQVKEANQRWLGKQLQIYLKEMKGGGEL